MIKDGSLSKVEALLHSLRIEYLTELTEKLDDFEKLVLELDCESSFNHAYEELYRQVHSMKGSAGTHGLHSLTAVCHHFEELLKHLESRFDNVRPSLVDHALKYVDLLREVSNEEISGHVDMAAVDDSLEALRAAIFPASYRGLYVDASKMGVRICEEALRGLPCELSVMQDGYQALGRLLQEKFDFVITSKELPGLNGSALLSAVRASDTQNANIQAILITSSQDDAASQSKLFNEVLKKSQQMPMHLRNSIEKITKN